MSEGIRSAAVAEQLLSVEAAAERLDTKPRFIRRLIAERRIEYHKVGRHCGSANRCWPSSSRPVAWSG